MSNMLFFAMGGLMVALIGLSSGFLKYCIDAKIDPVAKNVGELVQYMIVHEGKIATLEERSRNR